jgi:Domain of unknown function (DUF1839)
VAGILAQDLVGLSAMPVVLRDLSPAFYRPHALHDSGRDWPETNCYVDLWIEVLHALGHMPEAALGFTASQDFEGDQFTFFKFPAEDLALLFGIDVQELAIYDSLEAHVCEQMRRGRLTLVEVDAFYLPDTRGISYRAEHSKTTIAINRLDRAERSLHYFHNGGYFGLDGDDFDGVLQRIERPGPLSPVLFPYVEFVKFRTPPESVATAMAIALLGKHLARAPQQNPLRAFAARLETQAEALLGTEPGDFHRYAFNTLRQLGANFALLASHLDWLEAQGECGLETARGHCRAISGGAKSLQYQLARAVARRRTAGLAAGLDPLADAYEGAFAVLGARYL